MSDGAYLLELGLVPYGEALELQRSLAGAVSQGAIPETVVFLEHPPVVTVGRRTEIGVELDPAPFTDWITACGLEDAQFTTIARELGRPLDVEEVRPAAAAAVADVFELEFEALPADDGVGLWRQPIHAQLSAR